MIIQNYKGMVIVHKSDRAALFFVVALTRRLGSLHVSTSCHINATSLYLSLVSWNVRVLEILHSNPSDCHPDPSHDTCQNDQCWIVTHDR